MKLFERGYLKRKGESWEAYSFRMRLLTVLVVLIAAGAGFWCGVEFGQEVKQWLFRNT